MLYLCIPLCLLTYYRLLYSYRDAGENINISILQRTKQKAPAHIMDFITIFPVLCLIRSFSYSKRLNKFVDTDIGQDEQQSLATLPEFNRYLLIEWTSEDKYCAHE